MSRRAGGVRVADRAIAAFGLVVTSPVLLLGAIGIRLSDGGPVVHRARRAGLNGVPFTMYKLRTMRIAGTPGAGSRITGGTDPRIFPLGRLLRRFKVDELPQLVNVVRGEMAIVGPRPEDPTIVEREYASWMMETLTVPPGLTSPGSLGYYAYESTLPDDPAEAETLYLDELLPRKLAADLVYVRNRSLRYDVLLILRTILGLVGRHTTCRAMQAAEQRQAVQILHEVAR